MTTLTNSFEGGTNGTTLSTGNTGGTSGNAFDAINGSGTGNAIVFSSAQAAHGSLSMEISLPASVSATDYASWTTSMGSQTQVWFRLYLYITANPTVTTRIWQADISGSTLCGSLNITSTGTLIFTDSSLNALTSTNSLPLSAWCRVEGFLIGSATVGQVSFSLWDTPDSNGTPTETQTSAATRNTGGTSNSYRYGDFSSTTETSLWHIWMDDVGLSSTGALGPSVSVAPVGRELIKTQAVNRSAVYV